MSKLGRYGIKLKSYLENSKPLLFQNMAMDGIIMDYLMEEEMEIRKYAIKIEEQLRNKYKEPITNDFLEVVNYNRMIENIRDEFVDNFIYSLI